MDLCFQGWAWLHSANILRAVEGCQDGAVLRGGAPFAGMAADIARETGRIVLDGVEACIEAVERAWVPEPG